MPMILPIGSAVNLASVAAGAATALNKTPFLGGQGHEAIQNFSGGTLGTVKIQGHGAANGSADSAPAAGDAGWYDVATLTPATIFPYEIADLPSWIRVNVTGAGTGTGNFVLEGVQ